MKREELKRDNKGSVSIEAALLTPVIVMLVVAFCGIIRLSEFSANLKHLALIHADYSACKTNSFIDTSLINIRVKDQWLPNESEPYALGPYKQGNLMMVTVRSSFEMPFIGERVLSQSGVSKLWPEFRVEEKNLWSLPPLSRGHEIQEHFGRNLPKFFPVICKFENGIAVSIKSVDLTSKTYQNSNELFSVIYEAVLKLSDFNGANYQGASIEKRMIKQKELWIIVPKGTLNQRLREEFQKGYIQGKSKGVKVKIIEFQHKEE